MLGRIHSVQSMGLVDGPGVRSVVFLQGCALRCLFCHNPDTWAFSSGEEVESEALFQKLLRFRPYFGKDGGITFSGGEPLLQPQFLKELLRLCKEAGIHTCIDTCGVGLGEYEEILALTDLVLLDIKELTEDKMKAMTGHSLKEQEPFLTALRKSGVPVWIRHVIVPGFGDSEEHIKELKAYIEGLALPVEKVELLPYHCMASSKYEALGIKNPLEGIPPMEKAKTALWQKQFF